VKASELRQSILQAAVQGKLVPQNPNDESATELLKQIQQEKARLIRVGKIKKEKSLPPINEDEIPFDLPEGWALCRLGDIARIYRGSSPRPKGSPKYWSNEKTEFHWITIQDISNYSVNSYLTNTREFLTKAGSELSTYVEKGKLIIAVSGSTTGKACLTGIDGYIYDGLSAVDVNADFILPEYLLVFIKYSYFLFNASKVGSAFPNINTDFLKNSLFMIPPLAEQKRIVMKVNSLMFLCDKLEFAEKELADIESHFIEYLPKSILQAAVQGKLVPQNPKDEPAAELLKQIKQEKERLVHDGKIKREKHLPPISEDEIPYDLPVGWAWCRLSDFASFSIGKTPARAESKYWDNGQFPWVAIADMISGEHIQETKEKVSEIAYTEVFRGNIVSKGSLIFSFKLSIGKVCIVGMDTFTNEAICAITPYDVDEITDYLFRVFPGLNLTVDANSAVKGATLNSKSISNIMIPLPPLAEQQRINKKIDELMALCDELNTARIQPKVPKISNIISFPQKVTHSENDWREIGIAARGDVSQAPSKKLQDVIDDWDDGDE